MATEEISLALEAIQRETGWLEERLIGLKPEEWERPSNCPPWDVRRLVVHNVRNAETCLRAVELGLAGSSESAFDPEYRKRREAELLTFSPPELKGFLRSAADRFHHLCQDLSPEQLEVPCIHPLGSRSVRWFVLQRLSEVAFHNWDLDYSLGVQRPLDKEVALLILPHIIESNLPSLYRRRQRQDPSITLGITVQDAPSPTHWVLHIGQGEMVPERLETPPPIPFAISGRASPVALLLYGRLSPGEPALQAEGLEIRGEETYPVSLVELLGKP